MSKVVYDQLASELEQLSTQDLAVIWAAFANVIPGLTLTVNQANMVDSANSMDLEWRVRFLKVSTRILRRAVLRGYGE
jgi:hypothetical protein